MNSSSNINRLLALDGELQFIPSRLTWFSHSAYFRPTPAWAWQESLMPSSTVSRLLHDPNPATRSAMRKTLSLLPVLFRRCASRGAMYVALLGIAFAFLLAPTSNAATYTLTVIGTGDDAGSCYFIGPTFTCTTLRAAITQANLDTNDTINFSFSGTGLVPIYITNGTLYIT